MYCFLFIKFFIRIYIYLIENGFSRFISAILIVNVYK